MSRFTRYNQPRVICTMCGKRTTDDASDNGYLCSPCYDLAGLENGHLDGHHRGEPDPDCPSCQKEGQA